MTSPRMTSRLVVALLLWAAFVSSCAQGTGISERSSQEDDDDVRNFRGLRWADESELQKRLVDLEHQVDQLELLDGCYAGPPKVEPVLVREPDS